MLEKKNRREMMGVKAKSNLEMLKAQGKETYMEKHLFTQLKY